tara:strand:+ start:3491 stop:3886 length:396 start_codon:yes stop_codon:yes gene_type:complete
VSEFLLVCINFFLVSFGAILGSSLRWRLLKNFELILHDSFLGIFIVNNIAIFFLGLLLGFFDRYKFDVDSNSLFLFLSIGFLGSLSTFSSFIMELLELIRYKDWKKFLLYSSLSVSVGLFIAFIGYEFSRS